MIDGYRVFDAHVHIQPWHHLKAAVRAVMEQGRDDLADLERYQQNIGALEKHLQHDGIDGALLINYVSPDVMGFPRETNDWALAYTRAATMPVLPMGSVHPDTVDDVGSEAKRLVEAGVRAFKMHPNHQRLHPADERLWPLYEVASRHGVPVTIHTGTSVFPGAKNRDADPLGVDDVAVDFPDLRILLAHAGRPFWYDEAFFVARRHPHVYLELSGIPPAKLLDVLPRIDVVGEKLVWGTDWPSPGVRSMRGNVEAFLRLQLDDEVKRRTLWDNAAQLFGM